MSMVWVTNSNALFLFKSKVFPLLAVLFLNLFLMGCGGGSSNNSISSVSFYDENLDFIAIKQIEKGANISDVEPYSTTWFKANEVSQLKTFDFNTNIRVYAVQNVTEITTKEELNDVRKVLDGKYILLNDIALVEGKSGFDSINGWTPIGDDTNRFTGIFNGNGYKITNIWINRSSDDIGLFGFIQNAQIRNLGVEIAEGKEIKGANDVGGIAGYINRGSISNSYTIGNVNGGRYVGGIAGYIYGSSNISNSYMIGNVSGSSDYVGGIAGYGGGDITNSYSAGNINGSQYIGGIIGQNYYGSITNSYSSGNVSGNEDVGGIAGYVYGATIRNNAAINPSVTGTSNVNRVMGYINLYASAMLTNNFALDTMSGSFTSGNINYHGVDKDETALKTQTTYSNAANGYGLGGLGWKFGNDANNPWKIDEGSSYPYLYWQK
jgi:hypothetical protein